VTNRRAFLCGLVLGKLAAPLAVKAQPATKVTRIGYLGVDLAADDPRAREAFLKGLRDLGYMQDHNLLVEYRDAKGKPERFPALATELVASKVDVIVTAGGTLAALAAKRATATIPVVFTGVGDPVADGLVTTLARPRGNLTGLSLVLQLVDKLLELRKQTVPKVSRVALLLKPDAAPDRSIKDYVRAAESAARAVSVRLQVVEACGPEDFERAFSDMVKGRAGALAVVATPVFNSARRALVDLAAKNRLPTIFSLSDYVDAGGLMSYGPDRRDLFRRAARSSKAPNPLTCP
jgi:ABC-type uncharacterized transport system substrate-binding protein